MNGSMRRSIDTCAVLALLIATARDGASQQGGAPPLDARDNYPIVAVRASRTRVSVGDTATLTAHLTFRSGQQWVCRDCTWRSSDSTVARVRRVDARGLLRARSAGTVTITARTTAGRTGTVAITVIGSASPKPPPPPSAPDPAPVTPAAELRYANEPAGMTPLAMHDGRTVAPSGWWGPYGSVSVTSDPTSPAGRPDVLEFLYRTGLPGGSGPGMIGYGTQTKPMRVNGGPVSELFIGFYWKVNPAWQQPTGALTKLWYTYQQPPGSEIRNTAIPYLRGTVPGGPWDIHVQSSYTEAGLEEHTLYDANVTSPRIYPGRWYRMEFYIRRATSATARDAVMRWWIDGALAGDYPATKRSHEYFSEFHLSPIWGSTSRIPKQRDDYMRFATIYLSAR